MDQEMLIGALPDLIRTGWGETVRSAEPTTGPVGMGSVTAVVELSQGGMWVAKWVPEPAGRVLDRGSAIALELARAGIVTGEPLPTSTGQLSLAVGDGRMAMLDYVSGVPLVGDTEEDQRIMADILARVHATDPEGRRARPFMSSSLDDARAVEDWVLPAIDAVRAEYEQLPPLTWGIVHHDPAPEAFFHDRASGRVGLIDWAGSDRGPVLFDLASAEMYLGGRARAFWSAYIQLVPADQREEFGTYRLAFRRFRGAIQAAYFSVRVATSNVTGIKDESENWKGLHDARRMLANHGVSAAAW